jgi:hypothetical protein
MAFIGFLFGCMKSAKAYQGNRLPCDKLLPDTRQNFSEGSLVMRLRPAVCSGEVLDKRFFGHRSFTLTQRTTAVNSLYGCLASSSVSCYYEFMAGIERGRPNQGEGGKDKEQRPAYVDARRFPDEESAARAYREGQQALHKDAGKSDVSIYRFQSGPDFTNHVVVLGDPPPRVLQEKLEIAFGMGERVSIDADILQHLLDRRAQAKQLGPWVERHYRPGQAVWLEKRRDPPKRRR